MPASAGLLTDVATLRPDDYRAAGEWLSANGPRGPLVMVHGYRRVAAAYLPGAEVVSKPARGVDAVMVDPFVAERSPGGPAARFVRTISASWEAHHFGRITLWTRPREATRAAAILRP